ncbi:TPA: ATP-binding protein [Clostridioides difficile]
MPEINNKLLNEIKVLLEKGRDEIDKAEDQNLILILGSTGCGKSTAINYLTGCVMKEVEDEDTCVSYVECLNPVSEIGSGAVSQTLYPNIVDMRIPVEGMNAKLCDTAGFSDNRGATYNISAAVLLREVFERSLSICAVVVLIPEADILDSRLIKLMDLFQQLNMCLHRENFKDSITFFISKSFLGKTEKQLYNTIKRKYEQLCENLENNIEEKAWLFEEFLKDNGQNIHLCNPLASDKREYLLMKILELEDVKDKTSAFQYPISADAKLVLDILIKDIRSNILSSLEDYVRAYIEDFIEVIERITMIQEISKYDKTISVFKNWLENKESFTVDSFINVLTKENKSFLKENCINLQNQISENLDIIDALSKYAESENEKFLLSSVHMELIIEKTSKKIMEQKLVITKKKLEEILTSYEVQRQVFLLPNREKLIDVENEKNYIYSSYDFEPLFKNITVTQCEDLRESITILSKYREKGNEIIRDFISKYILNPFIVNEIKINDKKDIKIESLTPKWVPKWIINNEFVHKFILNPFIIKPLLNKDKKGIEIRALTPNLVISSVLQCLKSRKIDENISTFMFFAKETIYMDDNIEMDLVSEKNVILACNNLDVNNNVKINASGKNGELVDEFMYGKNGGDGKDAGNIYLYIKGEIRNNRLILIANGGSGSKGTNGEKGKAGNSGNHGVDGGYVGKVPNRIFSNCTRGEKGEKGGTGGNAGRGGNAGKKGNIYIIADSEEQRNRLMNSCDITIKDGNVGQDGIPGQGGEGGKGGFHGYNSSYQGKYFIFYQGRPEDGKIFYTNYPAIKKAMDKGGINCEFGETAPEREYAECGDEGDKGGFNDPNTKLSTAVSKVEENFIKEKYQNYCSEI